MSSSYTPRAYHVIYTVIMAFAVENAVQSSIENWASSEEAFWLTLIALILFIITAIPFYHGTIEHWERAYCSEMQYPEWLVQSDFYIALLHAVIFVVMANYIAKPIAFVAAYLLLIVVDVTTLSMLIIFVHRCKRGNVKIVTDKLKRWVITNLSLTALLFLIWFLISGNTHLDQIIKELDSPLIIFDKSGEEEKLTIGIRMYLAFSVIAIIRFYLDIKSNTPIRSKCETV